MNLPSRDSNSGPQPKASWFGFWVDRKTFKAQLDFKSAEPSAAGLDRKRPNVTQNQELNHI